MGLCCLVSAKLVVQIWLFSNLCGEMSAAQVEGEITVYSRCCTELLPLDSHLSLRIPKQLKVTHRYPNR